MVQFDCLREAPKGKEIKTNDEPFEWERNKKAQLDFPRLTSSDGFLMNQQIRYFSGEWKWKCLRTFNSFCSLLMPPRLAAIWFFFCAPFSISRARKKKLISVTIGKESDKEWRSWFCWCLRKLLSMLRSSFFHAHGNFFSVFVRKLFQWQFFEKNLKCRTVWTPLEQFKLWRHLTTCESLSLSKKTWLVVDSTKDFNLKFYFNCDCFFSFQNFMQSDRELKVIAIILAKHAQWTWKEFFVSPSLLFARCN